MPPEPRHARTKKAIPLATKQAGHGAVNSSPLNFCLFKQLRQNNQFLIQPWIGLSERHKTMTAYKIGSRFQAGGMTGYQAVCCAFYCPGRRFNWVSFSQQRKSLFPQSRFAGPNSDPIRTGQNIYEKLNGTALTVQSKPPLKLFYVRSGKKCGISSRPKPRIWVR